MPGQKVIYLDSFTWDYKEAKLLEKSRNYVKIMAHHYTTKEPKVMKIHWRRIKNRSEIWPEGRK